MPGVPAVLTRLVEDLGKESFHQSLLGTLGRLGAGYGLALAAGIGFGLVAAVLFFFREVLRSAIVILQSIPSIACVPLFLIVMGFGSAHHRGGGVVGILPGRAERDERHRIGAARACVGGPCHGRHALGLVKRVYLPAVMPELITGAQLAFGNAWRALISAEMLIGFGRAWAARWRIRARSRT